jgi:DNA polymerase-3 subunit beta
MKVNCDRAALTHWVQVASSVATQRSPKPALACVKIEAGPERMTLLATDLEVGVCLELGKMEVREPGAVLVPAERLHLILRELDADTVALASSGTETEISAPGARFKMLGDDPADFPNIPAFPESGVFSMPAAELLAMSQRTLFATAKEHTRYALNGVLWDLDGTSLVLVATDGHRLSHVKGKCEPSAPAPKEGEAPAKHSAIVPAKAMMLLERCLALVPDAKAVVRLAIGEREILASSPPIDGGRWTVYSRLVDGHFPKYEDLIPKDYDKKINVKTAAFLTAVRRAALLTTEESRGIHMKFGAGELTITSRAPEMGEAEVRMPVDYAGEDLEIVFSPNYLLDALKVIASEEFTFQFKTAAKPGLITEGRLFKYVVMPVSVV